jgi:SAM-dependent methyltransferase
MCKHNNWIKSILLEAGALIFGEGATFNAMDLACGRGGDLHKWRKVVQKFKQRIGVFYGIDNAPRALDHCRTVRAKQLPPSTQAHWLQEDLEQLDLFDRLASQGILHPGSIHLASMQFALHYFFRSEAALSAIFRLLASAMAEGGIFVTTYTDGNAVVRMAREQRWKDAIEAAKRNGGRPSYEPSATRVTSDLFSIQVASDTLHAIEESPDPFGHSFTFSLDNAVRHQKEFLVVDHVLDQVAQAFGFHPILDENFQPLTHDMMRVGSHQELMRIMKVFGKEPELHQAEWDAIGLYKAKIFVKDTSGGIFVPKAKEWIHRYLF